MLTTTVPTTIVVWIALGILALVANFYREPTRDPDVLIERTPGKRHAYRVTVAGTVYVGEPTVWFDVTRRCRCDTRTESWLCDVVESWEMDQEGDPS